MDFYSAGKRAVKMVPSRMTANKVGINSTPQPSLISEEQTSVAFGTRWQGERWSIEAEYATAEAENNRPGINMNFHVSNEQEDAQEIDFDFTRNSVPSVDITFADDNIDVTNPNSGWFVQNVWSRNTFEELEEDSFDLDVDFDVDSGIFTTLEFGIRVGSRGMNKRREQLNDPTDNNENFNRTRDGNPPDGIPFSAMPQVVRDNVYVMGDAHFKEYKYPHPERWFSINRLTPDDFLVIADALYKRR